MRTPEQAATYRPDSLLTPHQAAQYLGISRRQLGRLNVPAVRLGERTIRYLFKHLVSWLEARAA